MSIEILKQFRADNDDPRKYIHDLFTIPNCVDIYATNGHALLWTKRPGGYISANVDKKGLIEGVNRWRETFEKIESDIRHDLIVDQEPSPEELKPDTCKECIGGVVYWDTENHEYSATCKECNGEAKTPKRFASCVVSGHKFNWFYIKKLKNIDGLVCLIVDGEKEKYPSNLYFKSATVSGILMGMYA